MAIAADVLEEKLLQFSPELLNILLRDNSKSTSTRQRNIFWATDDYKHLGPDYHYDSEIKPQLITGDAGLVIMPRVLKDKQTQNGRVREMAEVFTPSWVCNAQNNLVDSGWFGRENVFNTEIVEDGMQTWIATDSPIQFPEEKTWQEYVDDVRLEVTCGEAPYIVSRYDTTTGEFISVNQRIGLLDRKLRVINENVQSIEEWKQFAERAFKSIYAYEWQGDSLLIARESMLASLIEYYFDRFNEYPEKEFIHQIARIIAWNVWQMDGIKGVVPNSCKTEIIVEDGLFGETSQIEIPCEGCVTGNHKKHNGVKCRIKDWYPKNANLHPEGRTIRFIDLIK